MNLQFIQLIETERLVLRRPIADDVAAIHSIHSDPQTNLFNPNGPLKSIQESEQLFVDFDSHWKLHGFGYWAVKDKSNDQVVGIGGIVTKMVEQESVLNLYYRFSPGFGD